MQCEESPHPPALLYLRELINLLQSFLYLEPSPVACDPVHYSHHGLFHHLPVDEALQNLSDLDAIHRIACSQLLHLKHTGTLHVSRNAEHSLQ